LKGEGVNQTPKNVVSDDVDQNDADDGNDTECDETYDEPRQEQIPPGVNL
jgi:hypothetical protein